MIFIHSGYQQVSSGLYPLTYVFREHSEFNIKTQLTNGASDQKDRFSLWEIYQAADFVTYPSLYEGFGNAFLEAIYFKKPMLVNRYKVFIDDIEPKGFELVKMDGVLTDEVVKKI